VDEIVWGECRAGDFHAEPKKKKAAVLLHWGLKHHPLSSKQGGGKAGIGLSRDRKEERSGEEKPERGERERERERERKSPLKKGTT